MLNENPVNMFFDPAMDRRMVEDGYLVLPFLKDEEIESFKTLYTKWHPEHPKEFFKSYFDPRMDYKKEVEKSIIALFDDRMSDIFRNYNAFGGLFVVKPPNQEGHLPPHQDWSFVDEKINWTINMWCPLEDVDASNGNITVLKGSHQFKETIRGVGTPDIYRDQWKLIEKNMESIPMKAGEAIFFFHGILHGSTLNTTPNSRVSMGLTLTPEESQHRFHYMTVENKKQQLECFETIPEFYIEYATKRGARPTLPSTFQSFDFTPIQRDFLIEKIRSVNGSVVLDPIPEKHTINWFNKIRKSLKSS
ncbi:MAG: hypothetical protein ACI837_002081 [Crocinitomicaceae bacterium]|jgi:hypothetical protein